MGIIARILGRERQPSNQIGEPVPIAGYYGPLVNYQELYQTIYTLPADQQRLVSVATGRVAICANLRAAYAANVPIREYTFKGSRAEKTLPCRGITRKTRNWLKSRHAGKSSIYADGSDEIVEIEQSDELDLLKDPSPDYSGVLFHRFDYLCRDFVGNSYWLITDPKRPMYATPLWPQWVTVIPGDDRLVKEYGFGRNRGKVTKYQPEQVLHLRHGLSLHSPLYGIGPLHHVAQHQRVLQMALAWELAYWQNDATPNGVYSLDATLAQNKTVVEQIKSLVEQRHQGPAKAGRSLFLPGVKWQPTSQIMRDMQYQEGVKAMIETIDSAYGMGGMVNPADSGGSSVGDKGGAQNATEERFLRQTITPLVANKADQLTEGFLPYFGIRPGDRWFAPEVIHRDDPVQMSLRHATYLDKGVLNINEARGDLDLEPIEGGDEYRINGIPLADAGKQPAFGPFGMPHRGTDEKPKDEPKPTADEKSLTARIFGLVRGHVHKESSPLTPNEDSLMRAVRDWMDQIDWSMDQNGNLVFDSSSARELFARLTEEPTRSMYADGYDAGKDVGGVPAFTVEDSEAAAFLGRYQLQLSWEVTNTVEQAMRAILADAVSNGATIQQTTNALRDTIGNIAQYGAERIARTETSRAYQQGNMDAWKRSGVVVGKVPILAPGACSLCRAAFALVGDKVTPLDEPFFPPGTVIQANGKSVTLDWGDGKQFIIHPNDRCGVKAVLS